MLQRHVNDEITGPEHDLGRLLVRHPRDYPHVAFQHVDPLERLFVVVVGTHGAFRGFDHRDIMHDILLENVDDLSTAIGECRLDLLNLHWISSSQRDDASANAERFSADDFRIWDRDDEFSATQSVFSLLFEDFLRKIPG